MARIDYRYLEKEISRRFPGQSFLIVHYGDHQPMATWSLLGIKEGTRVEEVMAWEDSPALITYYALRGIRYQPAALPKLETLDVPYLATVILEAAGLPLSDAFREHRRLMTLCNGRYHGCAHLKEIPLFHRRLINAGLLDPR